MGAGKTASSIIFLLIMLVVIYGAIKLFVLKESVGIEAIDKLIPGSASNLLFAKWERADDPTTKIKFYENGTWKSSTASGTFTAIGSKCLKLNIGVTRSDGTGSSGLPSKVYFVVVQKISENELTTAECYSDSCRGCESPVYRYHKVKFEEVRIMKESNPDHALD